MVSRVDPYQLVPRDRESIYVPFHVEGDPVDPIVLVGRATAGVTSDDLGVTCNTVVVDVMRARRPLAMLANDEVILPEGDHVGPGRGGSRRREVSVFAERQTVGNKHVFCTG